jgi:DNA-binding NtrC family response regulator
MAVILIIDDEKSIQKSFTQLFHNQYEILNAYNGREALEILGNCEVDLVFLDYMMPGEDGLEILEKIKEKEPGIPVVMITAYGSFETIIKSTSLGAYDYLEKPLDIDKISIIAKRAVESRKMSKYVNTIRAENIKTYNLKMIVGNSQAMQNIFKTIGRLVNNDVSVLVTGESGTGKELIAKALHYNGKRKNEPFIAVNCSGLTESLLDNELFGHEPQAFTGAHSMKTGKFEAAGEGTIFLDEIGDMPLNIQTKLLRVLQEKEFQRLGGLKNIKLKARIIAATNRNLSEEVKNGNFREDLFYRINVAPVRLPSLRERNDDIPLLVDFFLDKASAQLNKSVTQVSENLMKKLIGHNWPGNVRELENLLISLCINAQGEVLSSEDFPSVDIRDENSDLLSRVVDDFYNKNSGNENLLSSLFDLIEKKMIEKAGKEFKNNKSLMAKSLGISRVTLQKKMSSE